ncbi:hypothetical protein PR048_016139 [Dryococelus australis]|uniref:Uncharacterized protein n=1 Tax=Dryococelus australis TaxID=614101 RepID=A0ABQ9HIX2_9NEOP|nr:hypothetical protein PR048_016139 [Dryococelus australis]
MKMAQKLCQWNKAATKRQALKTSMWELANKSGWYVFLLYHHTSYCYQQNTSRETKYTHRQVQEDYGKCKPSGRIRSMEVGDPVLYRNYTGATKWSPGMVKLKEVPVIYIISHSECQTCRRYIDQLLRRMEPLMPEGRSCTDGTDERATSRHNCPRQPQKGATSRQMKPRLIL